MGSGVSVNYLHPSENIEFVGGYHFTKESLIIIYHRNKPFKTFPASINFSITVTFSLLPKPPILNVFQESNIVCKEKKLDQRKSCHHFSAPDILSTIERIQFVDSGANGWRNFLSFFFFFFLPTEQASCPKYAAGTGCRQIGRIGLIHANVGEAEVKFVPYLPGFPFQPLGISQCIPEAACRTPR